MNISRLHPFGPRLLAAFGGLSLLTGLGLAASHPVRSAGGPIAVNVANTPLATASADNPAKQGVQFETELVIPSGGTFVQNFPAYTVPPGKRLVVESVNSSTNNTGDPRHYSITYQGSGGLGNVRGQGFFNELPDGSPYSAGASHPNLYLDAGNSVFVELDRTESTGVSDVVVTFTGYLVDIATPGGSS